MVSRFLTKGGTFFGWRMVALASITGAMTGPGQTIGVSVFIDHFIDDLDIGRSQVSTAYLVGTLVAATVLPTIGKRIDLFGVRRAMKLTAIAFGVALIGMSFVNGLVALTVGFFAIRLLGQGSLNLTSTLAVTHWFDRRRGIALGVLATSTRILMSLVPVLLNVVIEAYSWQTAWLVSAVLVWLIVIPIAQWGLIDKPADVGQIPDGVVTDEDDTSSVSFADSYTRSEAIRTSKFWIIAAYGGTVGLITTALNFHQISVLGEAGMNATEAAAMFLPQVVGAAAAGLLFGYLADRLTGRILIPMVMVTLVAALLLTVVLEPGFTAIIYAICLGSAAGGARTVSSTLLPRWFGVGHIGSIQSTIGLIGVAATAFGPVAYALGRDVGGNYGIVAVQFAILPIVVAIVAASMRSLPVSVRRNGTSS